MALDNFVLQNTNPLEAYLQGAGGIQTLQNNQQIMDARVAAQQLAQQKAQVAQAAAQEKQQMQNDLYNTTDPLLLAKKTAAYVRANPDEWQAVAASLKTLSDAQRKSVQGITAQVTSAVASGRPELGQQALDTYVQSLENSGAPDDQIAGAKYFQKQFSHDPKAAVMSMNLGSMALDPDSYVTNNKVAADTASVVGEEGRKVEIQPLEVANKKADTQLKIAQAVKSGADIQHDLATTRLAYQTQLNNSNNAQLSDAMSKMQGGYIDSATSARQSANSAEGLANAYLTLDPMAGPTATGAEVLKRLSSNSNEISLLRKQYIAFQNQGVLNLLPPGAASEKEGEQVRAGFPDANTKPETMAKWLQAYAKVQKDAATANELKAEWISANGNLGRTTKDITMGETTVPKGTTFSNFLPLAMKNSNKASSVAPKSSDPLARYAKYGQ